MRVQETIVDYHYVKPEHEAMHERLTNWARWVKVRPHGWPTHPMWRKALTSKQWDIAPHVSTPVNTLDAANIEKAVSSLPTKHRDAVRWHYVHSGNPAAMARSLAVSKKGLADLVDAGRTMLQNRL